MTEPLNKIVMVRTGPGTELGLHRVVAYIDRPTFSLEPVSGLQLHWVAELCREATKDEEIAYWRARAEKAERALDPSRAPAENTSE